MERAAPWHLQSIRRAVVGLDQPAVRDRRAVSVARQVGEVGESAFFNYQAACVDARPKASIPVGRSRGGCLLDRCDAFADVGTFLSFIEFRVMNPPPPVTAHVVLRSLVHLRREFGALLGRDLLGSAVAITARGAGTHAGAGAFEYGQARQKQSDHGTIKQDARPVPVQHNA